MGSRVDLYGLQWVNLALSVICFVGFTWAILRLFKHDGPMPAAMRLLGIAGSTCTLIQWAALLTSAPPLPFAVAGLFAFVLTLALFWWAVPYAKKAALGLAFTPDRSRELLDSGPYRWVRHPFYASYMLYWISGAVAAAEPWLLLTLAVMSCFYLPAMLREERELAGRTDMPGYRDYRQRTGMFFPRMLPRRTREQPAETEHP